MTKNSKGAVSPLQKNSKDPHGQASPAKRWSKKIFKFFSLLAILSGVSLAAYGFYLDKEIRSRFDGQLWQLPATVYARILHLAPGAPIQLNEVQRELHTLGYHKVTTVKNVGEYAQSVDTLELVRRPFAFEDGPELARHVRIIFDRRGVKKIEQVQDGKPLGFLRIEPKMLGMLDSGADEQRIFLPKQHYPLFLVEALIATEDRNFYKHSGVSLIAITRAFFVNLRAGRTVQGGSTLTQQLAKNLFLTRERTLLRKLKELYIALLIDYRYSKDEILEAYLNEVYLGQSGGKGIHGFGLGARLYFGRPVAELRIDQLALLVALIKGPSYYNPWRYPQRAKERRDVVLRTMMELEKISAHEYKTAIAQELDVKDAANLTSRQPAYFAQLRNEINQRVGDGFDPKVGLRVFSTLDPLSQSLLEKTVVEQMPALQKRGGKELEVAAVIADRKSGEIRAMLGGHKPSFDGFNRALNGRRQIGSLAKPLVFLSALEQPERYNLASPIKDQPISLQSADGQVWQPRNFDQKFRGEVSLLWALSNSYNIPTVNLGMELGLENVLQMLSKLGVESKNIRALPSLLLGAFALSPMDVTQMYQTIGSGGRQAKLTALRAVVTQNGEVLYRNWPTATQVVSEQASWLTMYALKEAVRTGTARFLQQTHGAVELAGKTGTTNDNKDSWFVGMDGREVATFWLGRDDNKATPFTGSSGALRLYAGYIKARLPEKLQLSWPTEVNAVPYRVHDNLIFIDCSSQQRLPVWDVNHTWRKRCEKN
ncbi:MAG: penicillin-binding protein 1B [Vibrionaceae bacterium]